MKLTANEAAALRLCLNYDNREDQLSDNYSNGSFEDFESIFAGTGVDTKKAAAALMGSLEKKGLGYYDVEGYFQFWLTEEGVNVIFDWLEENEPKAQACVDCGKIYTGSHDDCIYGGTE